MDVTFVGPAPGREQGGVDVVIAELRQALTSAGLNVSISSIPFMAPASPSVFHFHGVWQTHHRAAYQHCINNNLPYVVSPHGMLARWRTRQKSWKKWPYFQLVERKHLRHARQIIAGSDIEAREMRWCPPAVPVKVIPHGLTGSARPNFESARRELGSRDEDKIVLFLSRLSPEKGLELLLRAVTGVELHQRAAMKLVIVGTGPERYKQELQRYCRRHRSDLPSIEWVGDVRGEQKWLYFQGADLFCLPSFAEGFPLVVLEACQVGTPVVATTATPFQHLETLGFGKIVEPRPESIRTALLTVLTDGAWTSEKRQALSDWTWSTYSWQSSAERYIEVYRDISCGVGRLGGAANVTRTAT